MPQATPAWLTFAVCLTRRLGLFWVVAGLICFCPATHAADAMMNGQTYRPLNDIAAQYGMTLSWTVAARSAQLQNKYCTLECTAGERLLHLNNEPMALGFPIMLKQGMLYISKSDFENNISPLLSPGKIASPIPALRRIVIDPGHGGKDTGTQVFPPGKDANSGVKAIDNEKTHTLEVAMLLADELRKRGYEVTLTRTTDDFVELPARTDIANKANADLYISIHFNHADQDYVNGTEAWILPPPGQPPTANPEASANDQGALPGNRFDAWNAIAAFSVERTVTRDAGTANRGVKRSHLVVLKGLNMPGLLVECGFLSNPTERAKIDTADFRQKLALALANGIDLYKATLDQLRPPTPAKPAPSASSAQHPAATAVGSK